MARKHKNMQAPSLIIFISFFLLLVASYYIRPSIAHETNKTKEKLKGMFVFGSSTIDDGNNNFIQLLVGKANYYPYGIDFPLGPTGRFSNGKNVADFIGDHLGFPLIPPFADPSTKGEHILSGVNFGSGGCGILDKTGPEAVINMNEQIRNFVEVTLLELQDLLGNKSTKILEEYLFLVAAGNNDFLLNYLPKDKSWRPTVPAFVANLTSTYASQLQKLYNVGARKFVILTVYPLGCSPVVRKTLTDGKKCEEFANEAVHYFYEQLIKTVDDLNRKLPGSMFIVVNSYNIILEIVQNPVEHGFKNGDDPCCELEGFFSIGFACKEGGKVCEERDKYVYFDGQHNSEAVQAVIANEAFSSKNKTDVYPFNLKRLSK